jgi:hypothetical protein
MAAMAHDTPGANDNFFHWGVAIAVTCRRNVLNLQP